MFLCVTTSLNELKIRLRLHGDAFARIHSQRYYYLMYSRVHTETLPSLHGNVRYVTNRSATNKMVTCHSKQQEAFNVIV